MATIFSHALVAVAVGSTFSPSWLPRRWWVAGAFCAVLPDADVIAFALRIPYGDPWGHRGLTHSLFGAAVLAVTWATLLVRQRRPGFAVALYLFIATALHGLLDAMTDGGLGAALLAPFDDTRYFLPFRPLRVSPIGTGFFSAAAIPVLLSEFLWLALPSAVVMALGWWRYRHAATAVATETSAPRTR